MADMLADLLNNAGGQNWWEGNARGKYAPRDNTSLAPPAPPTAPATEPADEPADEPAQPAQPASAAQSSKQYMTKSQKTAYFYQAEIMKMKSRQAMYPVGSKQWNKYQLQIQQKIAKMNEQVFIQQAAGW